jgi:death-on-curing protein
LPTWVPEAAVRAIHSELMAEHGGLPGAERDGALPAALARPRNILEYSEVRPDLAQLAAAYAYGIARGHCFPDGNKRLALAVLDVFLQLNGRELIAPEAEAAVVIRGLAAGEVSEAQLAKWIEENSAAVRKFRASE